MKKLVVFYDHRIFHQKYGGISRYFSELFNSSDYLSLYSVIFSQNEYLRTKFNKKYFSNDYGKIINILLRMLNIFYGICIALVGNYDIFHPTYYKIDIIAKLNRRPMVVTIVDMIHEKLPEYFPSPKVSKLIIVKRIMIEKAEVIIAISENTKKDIVQLYDVNPSKIVIVYLASKLKRSYNLKASSPKNYILYVGGRGGYKNFINFVKAFSLIEKQYCDTKVLAVGGGQFSDTERLLFSELGLTNKFIQGNFNDADLWHLYKNAKLFIYPSLYEGFGIPILEAFESSCPVALSETSCFPEIAGNAAIYFNPLKPESIAKSILSVLDSEQTRNKLIELGRIRLSDFSWAKTLVDTYNVYKRAISRDYEKN